MCTSRDIMAASGMEFSVPIVWICCCSLMKSWLIMFFLHKICTRPIGRLVSQFYSSLGCFYLSGTTGRVVSSNTAPDSKVRGANMGPTWVLSASDGPHVGPMCYHGPSWSTISCINNTLTHHMTSVFHHRQQVQVYKFLPYVWNIALCGTSSIRL